MTFQIFNDDCFKIMKTLPDKSIDIFISDLPYASKNFGKCVTCDWDISINFIEMWKEFKRLRKSKNTPFFFFCNVKHGYDLIRSNPKFFRYEICWIKSCVCGFLNARKMPLKKTEYIYVFYEKLPFYDISSHKHKFIKSNRKTDNKDLYNINNKYKESYKKYDPPLPNNVLRIKSQRGKHQTQKPIDIYKWILKYYSKKGWKCFDMTMGSGSCGVACKDMGINFIGIEKDIEIFEVAKDRIENGDKKKPKKKPKKKKVKKVSKNIEI